MALTQLSPPFPIFTDRTGRPLDGGYLYFGEVDQDPETAPITVYFDSALTQPAVQPLRTSAGYVMRDNAPALLYADGKFSVTVKDKQERLVIYAPSTFGLFDETGLLFADNNLSDVDDAATARANLGVAIASKAQAEAGTDNATFMTPLRTEEARQANAGGVVLGPFATTSGTEVTVTGIPTWATEIVVMLDRVSSTSNARIELELGSGSFTGTAYTQYVTTIISGASTDFFGGDASSSFALGLSAAATELSGNVYLVKKSGNEWSATYLLTSSGRLVSGAGFKPLSGVLDRLRLTVTIDALDGGSFTVRCK